MRLMIGVLVYLGGCAVIGCDHTHNVVTVDAVAFNSRLARVKVFGFAMTTSYRDRWNSGPDFAWTPSLPYSYLAPLISRKLVVGGDMASYPSGQRDLTVNQPA